MTIEVVGVPGLPRISAGDDLAAMIDAAQPRIVWPDGHIGISDGDVVVVTSKVVSKAEGRTVQTDRETAITAEAVRTVATKRTERGVTRIVETRHGFILAAAGVDASNTEPGTVVLLPEDPDASARRIRSDLAARTGCRIGLVITDTMGRAWREGLTDAAIGCAGVTPLDDHRGRVDAYGIPLEMTVLAIADEIAAAADLVKGKSTGMPVAVVRGLSAYVSADDGPGAAALVRPAAEDLFALGTAEARAEGARTASARRRTVRRLRSDPVPDEIVLTAVRAAVTAPAPHHTRPWRFVECADRRPLLDAMRAQWEADLRGIDGLDDSEVGRRVARGDLLRTAPRVLFAFVDTSGAHAYPDERRTRAERDLFIAAGGGAVQSLCIALAAEGVGSAWISSSIFCPDVVRTALGLPTAWNPLGAIAIGYAETAPSPREEPDLAEAYVLRAATNPD